MSFTSFNLNCFFFCFCILVTIFNSIIIIYIFIIPIYTRNIISKNISFIFFICRRIIIRSRYTFIKPSFNSTISLLLKVFNYLSIINKILYSFFINSTIFFNILVKVFISNTRTYFKISFNINLTVLIFNISFRISTFISNIHITIYIEESFTIINTKFYILFIKESIIIYSSIKSNTRSIIINSVKN